MFEVMKKFYVFLICFQFSIPLYIVLGNDSQCGLKKIVRTPKIINGNDAYHGQYPWAISLRLHRRHHCGGALINNNWILTAAHCVAQMSHRAFTVRLGAHYRSTDNEPTSVEIPVSLVVAHESFSFSSFANDIALLKLAKSVDFNNYIAPVCLPTTDGRDYTNQTGIVIGWGKITTSGTSASTLQQVELPIIDNNKCIKWYESQGKVIPIRSSQFCAGLEEGGKDACQGDSGSPMMRVDKPNGQAVAIGIVSAGIGCALPKLPGLYTRVASYLSWIHKIIDAEKIPTVTDAPIVATSTPDAHIVPPASIIHILPPSSITNIKPTTGPIIPSTNQPTSEVHIKPPSNQPTGAIHIKPPSSHPTGAVHIIPPSNHSHVIIFEFPNITITHPNKILPILNQKPLDTRPTPLTTTTTTITPSKLNTTDV